jgi:hypothetical protein
MLHEEGIKLSSLKTTADLGLPEPRIQDGCVLLDQELAQRVLYWELDPAWDGGVFHSRQSAARPWRKGELKGELTLPAEVGQVCLRIVLVDGEVIQQTL